MDTVQCNIKVMNVTSPQTFRERSVW